MTHKYGPLWPGGARTHRPPERVWFAANASMTAFNGLRQSMIVAGFEYGVFKERWPDGWTIRRRPVDDQPGRMATGSWSMPMALAKTKAALLETWKPPGEAQVSLGISREMT